MELSSAETELKLALSPSVAEAVFSLPVFMQRRAGEPKSQRLVSTYYETPEKDLARRGVSLRIRRADDKRIQTVKSAGEAASPILAANGNGRSKAISLISASQGRRRSPISSPMYPRTGWNLRS